MNTVIAFIGGSLIGMFLGYALAVVLVTGWSYSFTIRYGLWRALNAKDMMEFYERAAVEERQLYALHYMRLGERP
jgi:hypothetical protein